ncbi:hypothetical protein D3C77_198240 [compost metagenome]
MCRRQSGNDQTRAHGIRRQQFNWRVFATDFVIEGELIAGVRAGLVQFAIAIFCQQVRHLAVVAEAQLVHWGIALAARTLGHIDVAEGPVLQMSRFGTALWVDAGPEAMQHALEQVGPQLKERQLLLGRMSTGHGVEPVEHFLLLLQGAASLQLVRNCVNQVIKI